MKKQNKTGKDFDENGEKPEKRKKNLRLDKGGGKLRRVSCVNDEGPQKMKKKNTKLKDTNLSLQSHSPELVSRKK